MAARKTTAKAAAEAVENVETAESVETAENPEAAEAAKEPEMLKVVVKTRFKDKACKGKLRRVGEVLEIAKERFDEIAEAGKKHGTVYVEVKEAE